MDNLIKEKVHCLIIGSGPAGYTAAIYTARAKLKTVLYQGPRPGGQLLFNPNVEGYPGYPDDNIPGSDIMANFERQAIRMGAEVRLGVVLEVNFSQQPYCIWADDEKIIEADTVIVATGGSSKLLEFEEVSSEAKEKIKEVGNGKEMTLMGSRPISKLFKAWLEMDEAGYIKTIPGTSKTNIEGVFACGDVQDSTYRHAVIAAGSGCIAALDATRYLSVKASS